MLVVDTLILRDETATELYNSDEVFDNCIEVGVSLAVEEVNIDVDESMGLPIDEVFNCVVTEVDSTTAETFCGIATAVDMTSSNLV